MDKEQIKRFLSDAITKRTASSNEAQMIGNFVSFLRPMFSPENPIWVDHYVSGIETKLKTVRGTTGSIDVFVDSTVIEFERDIRGSHFSIGKDQVYDYCNTLINSGLSPDKLIGVLSDTVDWYFYKLLPSPTGHGYDLHEIAKCNITTVDDSSATLLGLLLETYLGRKEVSVITGKALANDFGVISNRGKYYIDQTKDFIQRSKDANPDYSLMISELWEGFIAKYTSPDDIDSYLFEYYLSIVGKLLCANILSSHALISSPGEISDIIKGEYFTVNYGYTNLVVYDYFGWLNDVLLLDSGSFVNTVSKMQEELSVYDYSSAPSGDIFGEMMSNLALNSTRILLGQEPTPQWLSDSLVEKVSTLLPEGEFPHFVDMCCGSGSMIISTIDYCTSLIAPLSISFEEKRRIIRECIEGIDIDPLSVLLSKINWIIHTRTYFVDVDSINIPIFHADSLFIVSPVTSAPGCYDIYIDGHRINMPSVLLKFECGELLSTIIDKAVLEIENSYAPSDAMRIAEATISSFSHYLSPSEHNDVAVFFVELQSVLYDLHILNRNGIWGYLIDNGYKPAMLRTRYNGIVSNTPWLALSKVKDNPYKTALISLCAEFNITPSGSAAPHAELATAFLLSAIERYLEPGTPFGCILPHSVINGDNHIKFRKTSSFNNPNSFEADYQEIWDLPKGTFKNRAIALFGKKQHHTPSTSMNGRIYSDDMVYTPHNVTILNDLNTSIWSFSDLIYHPAGQYYQFNQGADIMPRCFYYYNISPNGTTKYRVSDVTAGDDYYYLRKDDKYDKYHVPSGCLNRSLFRRTIVSKALMPFCVLNSPWALLPIKRGTDDKWEEFSDFEYSSLPVPQQRYLKTMKNTYFSLEHTALYGEKKLDFRKKLSQQQLILNKYLVIYGASGANISASFMYINDEVKNSVIDQTIYWSIVDTYNEAVFIVGLLNSSAMSDAIEPYQPEGEEGLRHIHATPPKFIPQYDSSCLLHQAVVNATDTLLSEIGTKIQVAINLKKGTLQKQRLTSVSIIQSQPSYLAYETACTNLLASII